MKTISILMLIIGSLAAGGASGYVASTIAHPAKPAVPSTATAELPGHDYSQELRELNGAIANLREDVARLSVRQERAEAAREQPRSEAVNPSPGEVSAPVPQGGSTEPRTDVEFQARVEAVVQQLEEKRRAEERANWERRMTQAADDRRKTIMAKLVDTLSLTVEQQSKIESVLVDYGAKRRELFTRAGQSRESGQEFDWRGETQAIESSTKDAMRSLLLAGQVQAFNELIGDGSIDDLAGRRMGMGMGPNVPGTRNGTDTRRRGE